MFDERYSLLRGGMLYRATHLGRLHKQGWMAPPVAIALLLIVLLPTVVLSAMDGTLLGGGVQIPLVRDYTVWARFVLAMPLLVLAVPVADERLWRAMHHLHGLVTPDDRARFEQVLERVRRWRDSVVPELILFVLAIGGSLTLAPLDVFKAVTDWRDGGGQALSPAGLWLHWVGMPVFRFLFLVWTWRFVLWVCLLWRFSRLRLTLYASHPDGHGGLGFLGFAQAAFIVMPTVGSLLLCGSLAMEITYLHVTLHSLRYVLLGYVVLSLLVMIAPLALFVPGLSALKRASMMTYGVVGTDCAEQFDKNWISRERGEARPILQAGDSSALADYTAVYTTVSTMVVLPIQRYVLISFIVASVAPLLPLALLVMPVDEILDKLLSSMV
ncbi:hypothetical protein QLQ15_09590 [Lysobacter sp. LF1]|uniref:Uncharacterized protein n=1 Tax=Lysobacter stagni TaxID=3045172 RepID=A0ABT6XG97_9GAMM|nr:hypothetical protein [Lysobacter sp. LF1]MDI9239162.1 hypothetical protein [Lysobacter sp. LF1]